MSYDRIIRDALRLARAPRRFASGGEAKKSSSREENFRNWFGNSKAIDGEGKPWVHYHATSRHFSEFIPGGYDPSLSGPAIWLTPHKHSQPAAHNVMGRGTFREGANVMPLYVKIENPLYVTDSDREEKAELVKKFGSKSYSWPMTLHPEDVKKMKDAGYDGIFHINDQSGVKFNPETGEGLETIVFDPSQLKSAIGNSGEFNPNSHDITKSHGGMTGYASGGGIDPNDISPSISNPVSVFPKPQRMFPSDAPIPGGQYLGMPDKQDMTGHKSAAASIGVHPGGKPYFNASRDAVDQTGTAGKAKVKTNLFKQKAGWSWQAAPEGHEDTSTIVSVEHRGKHYYTLNAHFPKGVDFARYAESRSEPRLRPTTTGDVFLGPKAGTISVRGKQHPVYHHVVVKADGGAVGYASGGDVDQPRQLDDRGFYSAAAEAARSLPQAKGSPSQMMATMKGVKPSELEWSGAGKAFANQKTVTRDDLAQHFEQNVPKITETVLGGNANANPRTKYQDYTLGNTYGNEIPRDRNYREILLGLDNPKILHQSSHWDEPNVIAHLRMQDRGPNNDVLHLEELQSDWAQKGRDEGFFTKEDLIKREAAKKSFEEYSKELADKYGLNPRLNLAMYRSIAGMHDSEVEKYEQLQREAIITGAIIKNKKINPAPYVTNTDHWTELALKRALIEAARGGYNKLVWTPGEEQAKRYRLGNHVDSIKYNPDAQILIGYKNGEGVFAENQISEDMLPNYIGRELSDEIMQHRNRVEDGREVYHELTGQQLFMGGKGMKKYYGEILPNALRRVLKPHTNKIQPTSHVVKDNDGNDVTLPGIEITPEMRDSILKKGFSHYAHGGEVRQHFEVGGGAEGGDSGGDDSSNGDGDSFSSNSDMADFGSQTEREDSSPAAPSYSPTDQDPSMLGGATEMAFSPLGSGSLGVGTGQVSGSVLGNAEQNLNTGPGVVGFIGGSPLGALAYAMEQINNTYYDGKARADVDQNVGGPSSGQNPDVVYPQSANPSGGFRLSSDDEETQAGMVKPVAFAPPAPPMMASGGKARNSHPVLSIPGVHIREEIHGRPIFLGDRDG